LIALFYPASVKFYCDECIKEFPFDQRCFNKSLYYGHNLVFFVSVPDYKEPVCSFPYSHRFDAKPYRTALSFLKGANTISELAEGSFPKLSASEYLFYIRRILLE